MTLLSVSEKYGHFLLLCCQLAFLQRPKGIALLGELVTPIKPSLALPVVGMSSVINIRAINTN